jgi:hypothetical protein
MFKFRIPIVIMLLMGPIAVGCGDDGTTGPSAVLAPPPAGQGLQIKMTSTLEAGLETERCMFYRVPAEGLAVNRQEIRYTPGSHHVLLFKTPYTEIPTTTVDGRTVDTQGVFDCGENGATGDWEIAGVAGGAQSAAGPPGVDGLPSDTAFKIDGNSLLLVNTHYLNASDKPLVAEVYINLFTIPPEQVTREAGIFFFYNPFISVPAGSASVAREVCAVSKDVTLVNAQSHMHRRGVSYTANLLDASGAQVQEIYTSNTWEHVVAKQMNPALPLSAGQMIDFRCNYMNNEDHTISQGRTTRDEMCMFLGLYYPKDTKTELCSMTDDWGGRYLAANWIGNGTVGGLQTAGCLQAATGDAAAHGDIDACVVNACPAISAETSSATRCLASRGLGQCATECGGTDMTACRTCVGEKCTPAMTALAAAVCP